MCTCSPLYQANYVSANTLLRNATVELLVSSNCSEFLVLNLKLLKTFRKRRLLISQLIACQSVQSRTVQMVFKWFQFDEKCIKIVFSICLFANLNLVKALNAIGSLIPDQFPYSSSTRGIHSCLLSCGSSKLITALFTTVVLPIIERPYCSSPTKSSRKATRQDRTVVQFSITTDRNCYCSCFRTLTNKLETSRATVLYRPKRPTSAVPVPVVCIIHRRGCREDPATTAE